MLRRAPTTITLTGADVESYEANRQRKLWEKEQADSQLTAASEKSIMKEPNVEAKSLPKEKSKKDRIMGTSN
ncbi:hypothetical protein K469DRAFT_571417 [Zopfia rhizophila CBS 207.26]|uniref:Anaphase-promoting complex, subunit CDC26 n=1 Tax=Zopfia rhizophila CBS 207.26 TaxID=1314779 RepID=A0A6A6E8R5_9PEZI|nr:hypothetical protein K469DRAFT_571417 [Zopfia rhizophila CBS 207.26]